MEPSQSAVALAQFFSNAGLDFDRAALPDMVDMVLRFYMTVRAQDLSTEPDADMLLFQFGTYEQWDSTGEVFTFDITRQFIEAEKQDDDAMSQLSCAFYYAPTAGLKSLGTYDRWCKSHDDAQEFRSFILSTGAYQAALPIVPVKRRIYWTYL